MKKLLTSLLLGAMVFAFADVQARNVSEQEARVAAAHYFSHNSDRDVKASDLTLVHQIFNNELNVAECFMYNVGTDGWIIMSGTAAITPVIAYSEDGQLPANYSELPTNMAYWLGEYTSMIGELQDIDQTEELKDDEMWGRLTSHGLDGTSKGTTRVLINSKWDQGYPSLPSYNMYCPQENGKPCYVGCVATAMAQIIRYWKCPVQPTGTVRYMWKGQMLSLTFDTLHFDYTQMPVSITNNQGYINATDEQVYNVAMLSYACGISVKMNYGIDGSGTQSEKVIGAMHDNFRFVYGKQIFRNGTNDTSFVGRIRRNLMSQVPVYMSGQSSTYPPGDVDHSAGHAWLCVGYRIDEENTANEKMYYMNWGWGGSGNGWFNLSDNNLYSQATGYNFNVSQAAIVGLHPQSPDSTSVNYVGIPEVADNTELFAAYPNPATMSVTLPYRVSSATEMTVYSIDGKVAATRSLQPGEGAVELNVSNMPAGIYIYRVGGKSGKFMVQ